MLCKEILQWKIFLNTRDPSNNSLNVHSQVRHTHECFWWTPNFVKPLPIYVSLTFCSRIAICCVPLSLHWVYLTATEQYFPGHCLRRRTTFTLLSQDEILQCGYMYSHYSYWAAFSCGTLWNFRLQNMQLFSDFEGVCVRFSQEAIWKWQSSETVC